MGLLCEGDSVERGRGREGSTAALPRDHESGGPSASRVRGGTDPIIGGSGEDIAIGQSSEDGEDGGGSSVVMARSRDPDTADHTTDISRVRVSGASPSGAHSDPALERVSAEAQAAAIKCRSIRGLGRRNLAPVGGPQCSAVFVRRRSTPAGSRVVLPPGARPSTRRPPPANAIGRRWTLLIFTTVFSVGAILQTIAGGSRGLGYVYAGRVVAGVGIGAISAVAPAYVSECAPKDVRGRITGLFQIMVAIGVMLSYFINLGISLHEPSGPQVWRIPFGFQLVPAGIMALGLLTVTESPRWLASKGRPDDALAALAYLRRRHPDDDSVRHEMAEIDAALEEERAARAGLGWKEAFFGKGNWPRFLIAIVIFLLQQWSGQNSVGYYAPQIFTS
ncbi:hypothetical protein CERSUDRAFT_96362, partial [Gelatoporia subvermispora B]